MRALVAGDTSDESNISYEGMKVLCAGNCTYEGTLRWELQTWDMQSLGALRMHRFLLYCREGGHLQSIPEPGG